MFQVLTQQTGNESKHDAADVLPAKYKQITQPLQKRGVLLFSKMFQIVIFCRTSSK